MNSSLNGSRTAFVAVALLLTVNLSVLLGAASRTNSAAPRTPAVAADAAPVELEIPRSVFAMPATAKEGKDPFFPLSTRIYKNTAPVPVKTNQVPKVEVDLRINGVSGSDDKPLVIINNETFGVGDTRDVVSGGQKLSIKCLEIDPVAGRATVEVGHERRELFFQKREK